MNCLTMEKGSSGSGTRDQFGRPHQGHVRQGAADRVGLGEAAANLHEARRLQDPVTKSEVEVMKQQECTTRNLKKCKMQTEERVILPKTKRVIPSQRNSIANITARSLHFTCDIMRVVLTNKFSFMR